MAKKPNHEKLRPNDSGGPELKVNWPLAFIGEQPGLPAAMRRDGPTCTTSGRLLRDRGGRRHPLSPPSTAGRARFGHSGSREQNSARPTPSERDHPSFHRPGTGVFTPVRRSPPREPQPAVHACAAAPDASSLFAPTDSAPSNLNIRLMLQRGCCRSCASRGRAALPVHGGRPASHGPYTASGTHRRASVFYGFRFFMYSLRANSRLSVPFDERKESARPRTLLREPVRARLRVCPAMLRSPTSRIAREPREPRERLRMDAFFVFIEKKV